MSFLVSSRAQLRHVLAAPRSSPTCLPLRQTAFRRQSVKSLAAARQEVGTSTRNSVPPVAGHASAAVTVAAVAAFVGGCLACGDAGAAGLIAQPLTDLAFSAKDAKMTEDVLRPLFALFTVLYVVRIPMTWYPTIDGAQMPWALVYFPTEPVLKVARQVIPLVGGVDITPIVMVGITSFLNEILLGPQGILELIQIQGGL